MPYDLPIIGFSKEHRFSVVTLRLWSTKESPRNFQLQRYTVTWRRADGGPTSGAGWTLADSDFEGATSAIVPINTTTEVGILIAPAGMKSGEPFVTALATGEEIQLIADIDFIGTRAVASDAEIHILASLSVNFADFADKQ